jgi:ribulose-phosphate 3-epimerase
MNKRINPAILVDNLPEMQKQITGLSSVCDEFDIDIIDWRRAANKTLNIDGVLQLKTNVKINIDIQMDDPRRTIQLLLKQGSVNRIIINLESDFPLTPFLEQIHAQGIQTGISIDPETKSADEVIQYLPYCDFIQIMTIQPGAQGNSFIPSRLTLAMELRDLGYEGLIGIDGGVNFVTLPTIKKYPIDVLSVGSTLSKAENPAAVYLELDKEFKKLN